MRLSSLKTFWVWSSRCLGAALYLVSNTPPPVLAGNIPIPLDSVSVDSLSFPRAGLVPAIVHMIANARVLDALKIDAPLLATFVLHVEAQHDDRAPYHNMCHVFNVVQMLCIFVGWPEVRNKLEPMEVAALLIAGGYFWNQNPSTFEIGADFNNARNQPPEWDFGELFELMGVWRDVRRCWRLATCEYRV